MSFFPVFITSLVVSVFLATVDISCLALTTGCIDRNTPSSACCSGDIEISSGVVSIADYAFGESDDADPCSITSVIIHNNVKSIGKNAFVNNSISSINIPDNVTTIGHFAFYGNQITSLTLGTGVTSIGIYAFALNMLTSAVIPQSVAYLGLNSFSYNNATLCLIYLCARISDNIYDYPECNTNITTTPSESRLIMQSILYNPPESSRTYSSNWMNGNAKFENSMLDTSSGYGAWSAGSLDTNQYMTIDLNFIQNVVGVVTQARCTTRDYPSGGNVHQFVKTYKVGYSTDGITFNYATSSESSEIFFGPQSAPVQISCDLDEKVSQNFTSSISARYIRFYPQTWHNHISMRAGIQLASGDSVTLIATPLTVRIVRSVAFPDGWSGNNGCILSIAEVTFFDSSNEILEPVSYSMSSNQQSGHNNASYCFDKDVSTFCHTGEYEHCPQHIDIAMGTQQVSKIVVENRQDCCQWRIVNSDVYVYSNNDQIFSYKFVDQQQTYSISLSHLLPSTHHVPSSQPSRSPSLIPSSQPTRQPSRQPTIDLSAQTPVPSIIPIARPTVSPTAKPSLRKTSRPTAIPKYAPSVSPTKKRPSKPSKPSSGRTASPTASPSKKKKPKSSQ